MRKELVRACKGRCLSVAVAASTSLAIAMGMSACGRDDRSASRSSTSATPPSATGIFPLRVEPGKRYLVDASGKPFLLHGDAAWSLIAELSIADAELYLEDRRRKGFNAILVNLLEHKYARNPPRNFNRDAPFTAETPQFVEPSDYSKRNDRYFTHVDQVIQLAAEKDILVLLVPSYLGARGGDEGWYREMVANQAADANRLRDFGRYLGQRYASYSNILWVEGGDYDPPDKTVTRAIALGIREFDSHALHTAHGATESSALPFWSGESWLHVNSIYTYVNVRSKAQIAYSRGMPFFLIEGRYETEGRAASEGSELRIRTQAYKAL